MSKNKPIKASTMCIIDLIKTNALLTKTICYQQTEIENLNLRIAGLISWLKNKRKYTNKKFLRGEH